MMYDRQTLTQRNLNLRVSEDYMSKRSKEEVEILKQKARKLRDQYFTGQEIADQLGLKLVTVENYIRGYTKNWSQEKKDQLMSLSIRKGRIANGTVYSELPLEEFLLKTTQNKKIKEELIRRKIKEPICEECKWDYRSHKKYDPKFEICIPIQLHHKDGNNRNNLLENLQFLCPNCHVMTENWGHRKFETMREEPAWKTIQN